jgi:hypothetical protein
MGFTKHLVGDVEYERPAALANGLGELDRESHRADLVKPIPESRAIGLHGLSLESEQDDQCW